MNLPEDLNLPAQISEQVGKTRNIVTQSVRHWAETAQQATGSWQDTATQASGKVVDRVINKFTSTTEQAKDSLGDTFQTAIDSSLGHLLEQHPMFFKFTQILTWGANHPIISLIIIIFVIALIFSLIKAIARLIESASLSILRLPLKLIQAVLKLSFLYFSKFTKQLFIKIKYRNSSDSFPQNPQLIANNPKKLPIFEKKIFSLSKQQRLKEISSRLAEIQKEQHELLQEASSILNSDVNLDLNSNLNPDLNSNLNPDLNSNLNPDLNSDKIKQI